MLDGISLASILPGPVAVNLVCMSVTDCAAVRERW